MMDASALDIGPVTSSDDDLRAVVTAMALLDPGPGSIKDLRALRSTMRQSSASLRGTASP